MAARTAASISTDVLVCGGGLAGTLAAVAAARAGARVVLVERYGFLGGNATAGAVAQFNSWQTAGGRRVIGGLAQEVVTHLRAHGGAGEHEVFTMSTGHRMDRVPYSPELLKLVLDELVTDAGVRPLFHAQPMEVQREGAQVRALRVLTKGGTRVIDTRVLIDASGDLDPLRLAGARFLPLAPGETLQPATTMFRFGPIDRSAFDSVGHERLAALSQRGFEQGDLARAALHSSRDPDSSDAWFNIGRVAVDATDPLALSAAEIEGRRQAWRAAQFIRAEVPGCGQGRLRAFGTQIGVRETRRVEGDHVLTAPELMTPVEFPDTIAMGAYPIDIHPASGAGLDYRALGEHHAYGIPLRCLLPKGLTNALVAGRGISATHEALAAVRVMPIAMALGQAAGTAAALSLAHGGDVRRVDVAVLQTRLRADSALLA